MSETPKSDREREFDDCENDRWGWDGYQVEDAVGFARLFRRERDEAREQVEQLREALQKFGQHRGSCNLHERTPFGAQARAEYLAKGCTCGLDAAIAAG